MCSRIPRPVALTPRHDRKIQSDEIVLQQTMPLPPRNSQSPLGTAGNKIDDGDQVRITCRRSRRSCAHVIPFARRVFCDGPSLLRAAPHPIPLET